MLRRIALGVLACAVLAGCQNDRFSSVRLGDVPPGDAYRAAVATFRDYYRIDDADRVADREAGRIIGRPQPVDRPGGLAPARERAEMRIRTTEGALWADMRIVVERQASLAYESFAGLRTQHETPNQTPAQLDAALTPEQRDVWETTGFNRRMERRILADLYKRLHPAEPAP